MAPHLKGRSLLTLKDFSPEEIGYLIDFAITLKQEKRSGVRKQRLAGKNIALIFEKPSTRTRCAFVVACVDEGAHPEYLGKGDIQLGKKESVRDTARVLGRLFDGIEFRGFSHDTVEELARYADVPVWNGLTDKYHPTQALADLQTIKERKGRLEGVSMAYVGDGRNNVAASLVVAGMKMGMDVRIVTPARLNPSAELVDWAKDLSRATGARLLVTDAIADGVKGADAVYTDVWVSMGEEACFEERIGLLKPYQVTMDMLGRASADVLFLHCLPALHNRETTVGEEMYKKYGLAEMEVTDEAFESRHSVVFDQAENRMHTIKAVMIATITG